MPFFILSLILQVAFVIHILKTGRNTIWIWVVVMLPFAGAIAYCILELLPDLRATRTGKRASRKLQSIVNPNKNVNEAAANYERSPTTENAMRLADALLLKENYADAKSLYEKCLKGIHENDPHIMHSLAKAEFGLRNFTQAKFILDELIKHNPEYKNVEAHLLYARAVEATGDKKLALHEYEALDSYFPGPEASYHYAKLLAEFGDQEKSQMILGKILKKAKIAGRHYNELHQEWIKLAKAEYRQ